MGNLEGVVFRIVEGEDLVFGLLHEDVEPDGEVGADHVHQTESRDHPVGVHLHLLQHATTTKNSIGINESMLYSQVLCS